MIKPVTVFTLTIALEAGLSACAGPGWQVKAAPSAQPGMVATAPDCDTKRLALPPDHGPRAQTTAYLNAQRKARFDAETKACISSPAR